VTGGVVELAAGASVAGRVEHLGCSGAVVSASTTETSSLTAADPAGCTLTVGDHRLSVRGDLDLGPADPPLSIVMQAQRGALVGELLALRPVNVSGADHPFHVGSLFLASLFSTTTPQGFAVADCFGASAADTNGICP